MAVGEILINKRSSGWVSLYLPPDTIMGIPKLMPAMIKMATNKTMDFGFILQAFPVVSTAKFFRVDGVEALVAERVDSYLIYYPTISQKKRRRIVAVFMLFVHWEVLRFDKLRQVGSL